MKAWKWIPLVLWLGFALVAAPARSQLQRMMDQLNLTPDQKAKIDPILEDDAKQVRAFREDTTLSAEDRKAKTAKVRHETDAKIKPLLTDEQWSKLQQLRAERKEQGSKKKQQQD